MLEIIGKLSGARETRIETSSLQSLSRERLDWRKKDANVIVEAGFAIVTESPKRGERVKISGSAV